MTPSAIALLFGLAAAAQAQSEPETTAPTEAVPEAPPVATSEPLPGLETDEDPISKHRTRFDALAERSIGTASKPVAFNWRRTKVHVAAQGSFPFELNNFNSLRGGGLVRFPSGNLIVEVGVLYAKTWDTPSSFQLAYTPYRQPGRPSRLELDLTLAFPLAEGVVTSFPRWFPAVEMVFNAYGTFRYNVYPTGYAHMKPGQVVTAILSPALSDLEVENLDDARLTAMQVDRGRYGLLFGVGNDIYFEQGIFISPRMLIAIPVLAAASQTDLLITAELTLAIGAAF